MSKSGEGCWQCTTCGHIQNCAQGSLGLEQQWLVLVVPAALPCQRLEVAAAAVSARGPWAAFVER